MIGSQKEQRGAVGELEEAQAGDFVGEEPELRGFDGRVWDFRGEGPHGWSLAGREEGEP